MANQNSFYYESGLHFLIAQAKEQKDWISYLKMIPMFGNESVTQNKKNSPKSPKSKHSKQKSKLSLSPPLVSSTETMWRFWKWKPTGAFSRKENPYMQYSFSCGSPVSFMNRFKAHLRESPDHLYSINQLRQLSMLEHPDVISFVTDDDREDYIDHFLYHASNINHKTSTVRSYFIFKDGIPPLWEDEYNAAGGCWTLTINNNSQSKFTTKKIWKLLIKVLTDHKMKMYLDEICGVGLTVRSNRSFKVTVWNRDSDNTIVKIMIGHILKSTINHVGPMFYYSHKNTIKKEYRKKFPNFSMPIQAQPKNDFSCLHYDQLSPTAQQNSSGKKVWFGPNPIIKTWPNFRPNYNQYNGYYRNNYRFNYHNGRQ